MNTIISWFAELYTILAVVPFVVFFVLWGILYVVTQDKKRATRTSMDVTVLVLIGSVSMMIKQIFNSNFGFWLILLLFLVAAGLIGNVQNRVKGAINPVKMVKLLLRLGFMALSASYLLLVLIGVGKYIYIS